jgi:hypothetical protein
MNWRADAELKSDFAVESIHREIEILKLIDHPCCVQVWQIFDFLPLVFAM